MENFMLHPVGNTILLILYIVQFIAGILLLIKAIKMPNSTQQQLSKIKTSDSRKRCAK